MQIDPEQVREFLADCGTDTKLYLGADSTRFRSKGVWHADIFVALVIHKNGRNGCKVFGEIERQRDYDQNRSKPMQRMLAETYKVAEVFQRLVDAGVINEEFIENLQIHLDINPDESCGSSVALSQATGYIKAMTGITPMVKPDAFAASFAADRIKKWRDAA
jgi:predicted RNase H-related nuclease YkuK (DUF458 family)